MTTSDPVEEITEQFIAAATTSDSEDIVMNEEINEGEEEDDGVDIGIKDDEEDDGVDIGIKDDEDDDDVDIGIIGEDEEDEDDVDIGIIGEDEDETEPIAKKTYVFYVSGGAVIRVNKDDPSDKETIKRNGATNYVMDKKNNIIYYVMFKKNVVREDLSSGSKKFIVTGIQNIGDLRLDSKKELLYFTDTVKGKIESVDVRSEERKVIYEGLSNPQKVTVNPDQ